MVSLNLKVLAKFGLCSNWSQKLDECSLARARKIFATARMLEFSLKFAYGKTYGETLRKNVRAMNASGNISFILVKLAQVTILLERHPHTQSEKVTESRVMMTCRVLPILFDLQSLSEMYGFNWLDPS